MNLYVARNGETLGPYGEAQMREYLKAGVFSPDDLGCYGGEETWHPLHEIFPEQTTRVPMPLVPRRAPVVREPVVESRVVKRGGESVFFEQMGITVTSARLIVGAQTYAMRNVTSVRFACKPAERAGPVALMITGAVLGLLLSSLALVLGLAGVVIMAIGFAVLASQQAIYYVVLTTNAGQVHAVTSGNRAMIEGIVAALNQAIVAAP